jgi:GrpB-like predicted nucleotidyltransferase (UPF0157 family)
VIELDETIHLSEYDPQWPILFDAEIQRISLNLPADVTIEPIGSTSVPGLLDKPIVDIMVGTEPHHKVEVVRAALADLGYEDMGEAGVPGRIYFRRRMGADFNIALVWRNGPIWVANIALRDHLRTSPEARREYAETKRQGFDSGTRSLLAYSDRKNEVLSRLIAQALERKPPSQVSFRIARHPGANRKERAVSYTLAAIRFS